MKIVSIIITYNRKELLEKNLIRVLGQSIKHDVFVYDNASTDGTDLYLKEKGFFNNPNFSYYKSFDNVGGAGGFHNALKITLEKGYDFFWLMDDDGSPVNSNALKECLNCFSKSSDLKIVNSLVLNENGNLIYEYQGSNDVDSLSLKGDTLQNYINPFNGTLLSRAVIEKIGLPKSEFFIRGDEIEYSLRAQKNGIILETAVKSLYYHPSYKMTIFSIFGKKFYLTDASYWQEYYQTRNHLYIYSRYKKPIVFVWRLLESALKIFNFKTDRRRKSLYTLKGGIDGIFGNLSNKVKI